MQVQDAVVAALKIFEKIQLGEIQDVLIEEAELPKTREGEWQITVGYSPKQTVLGVPVAGLRMRSVIRISGDGSFLGMHPRNGDGSRET